MSIIHRMVGVVLAVLFGLTSLGTTPAAAANRESASTSVTTQTTGCTNVAYDPYVDYRPVNGVLQKVVVGKIRIECSETQPSINYVIYVRKTLSVNWKVSGSCGRDITVCEAEAWYRYSSGDWQTAGESLIANPRFSYSNKVQL